MRNLDHRYTNKRTNKQTCAKTILPPIYTVFAVDGGKNHKYVTAIIKETYFCTVAVATERRNPVSRIHFTEYNR